MTVPEQEDDERPWQKSSHSGEGQDCVEVRIGRKKVGVRDSKNPEGGHFELARGGWQGLIATLTDPS